MVSSSETSWRYPVSAGQHLGMADENEAQQHEGGIAGLAHNVVGAVEKTGDALLPEGGAQDVAHAVTGAADALVEGAATVADTVVDSAQDFVVGRAPEGESDEGSEQDTEDEGEDAENSDEASETEDAPVEESPAESGAEGGQESELPFA